MKKMFFLICSAAFILSCNNQTESADKTMSSDATTEKIDYAYMPSNHGPDNWDRGDQKNVALVLQSLKAWENKNLDEALAAFADSVQWVGDGFDSKMSKADLKKSMEEMMQTTQSIKIEMDDYETVVSKDGKNNWVSLWYKQTTTDTKGKVDSIYHMDDVKIENGKIVLLDEKTRKFPAPKK